MANLDKSAAIAILVLLYGLCAPLAFDHGRKFTITAHHFNIYLWKLLNSQTGLIKRIKVGLAALPSGEVRQVHLLGILCLSRVDGHLVTAFEDLLLHCCQSKPLDPAGEMGNQHGSDYETTFDDDYENDDFLVQGGGKSIYGGIDDFGLPSSSEEDEEQEEERQEVAAAVASEQQGGAAVGTAEVVDEGGDEALLRRWRRWANREEAEANLAAGKLDGPRVGYAGNAYNSPIKLWVRLRCFLVRLNDQTPSVLLTFIPAIGNF